MAKEITELNNEEEKNYSSVVVRDERGNKYTLEFSRKVVEAMERRGFKVDLDFPNSNIKDLWRGAFQKNHRGMMNEKMDEIWNFQRSKDELLAVLLKLYMKPLETLMAEPEAGDDENPTWEAN